MNMAPIDRGVKNYLEKEKSAIDVSHRLHAPEFELFCELANLCERRPHGARERLQTLLGWEIVLHPSADGVERFLTAELSGAYAGMVRLTMLNNRGGGHTLPVPLRLHDQAATRPKRGSRAF